MRLCEIISSELGVAQIKRLLSCLSISADTPSKHGQDGLNIGSKPL
jgi:hypothetical protein